MYSLNRTTSCLLAILGVAFFSACSTYKQNILFSTEGLNQNELGKQMDQAVAAYTIRKNDYLKVDVYTNNGERIIDPNFELLISNNNLQGQLKPDPQYLVQHNGIVKLPVVGDVHLDGLTLDQADSLLETRYRMYYKEPFVITQYVNKRVIVLGASGGQVIPLVDEGVSVLEILALAGGLDNNSRGNNIKVIRGDLKDPEVFVIDLTTIQGLREAELSVMPGDVIYVEPIRRPVNESARDIAPLLSVVSTLLALVLVINTL